MSGTNKVVNPDCLDGLEILREHNLVFLNTPKVDIFADFCQPGNGVLPANGQQQQLRHEESKDTFSSTEFLDSWQSEKVRFDQQNGSLVFLDLGGRRLHKGLPCDPRVFEAFRSLRTLSLAGTDLPLKDILAIVARVAGSIESLYLGGNGLRNIGAEAIAASNLLRNGNGKLTKLDLRFNEINSAGMIAICNAMIGDGNEEQTSDETTSTSNLQYLYMEGNAIGDEGCKALAKTMSSASSSIREIYLGANKIGPAGAKALADSLRTNKTVSKIYLEGNLLGPEGAASFCEVLEELKGDTALRHLYVDNNEVGKEVSNRLARALRSETAIQDVRS